MAREELRYVLGNLIHQARNQKALVSIHDIKFKDGDQTKLLSLHATPLDENGLPGYAMVVIEEKGLIKRSNRKGSSDENGPGRVVAEMEKELVYTQQQLISTIEQMETSLEELKSTNEELQSTNEELQSTNEESLTTKEEMQSLNEELMTVNVQYQSKAEELSRLNNDMKNLLDATEIGIIFLNNELELLRYTPPITKMFNIIPSDVGRSLSDIVSNFDYPHVEDIIREVIERLLTREVEVKTKGNDWYTVRIMPYRTLDNFISGAVLTFTLISSYKKMQSRLEQQGIFLQNIVRQMKQPALQLDHQQMVLSVSQSFADTFGIEPDKLIGTPFADYCRNNWRVPAVLNLVDESAKTNEPVWMKQTIGEKEYDISASQLQDSVTHQILSTLITLTEVAE
jgi:two-component system CheB/CheR fusion protein